MREFENDNHNIRDYVDTIIRPKAITPPWPGMILCAFATSFPIFVGLIRDELIISIYGSLAGFLLALSDNSSSPLRRIGIILFTFAMLAVGFTFGNSMHHFTIVYMLTLGALVYWLGMFSGEGNDLERTLLFTTISMLTGFTGSFPNTIIPLIILYTSIALLSVIVGIIMIALLSKEKHEEVAGLASSAKKSLALRKINRSRALTYAIVVLLSIWFSEKIFTERSSWVTITVLLVMKPDQNPAMHRIVQRFIGTILAVLLIDLLLFAIPDPRIYIFLIPISALGIPWGAKKNYWIVSFLSTFLAIFMLEIITPEGLTIHTPFLRLTATAFGCVLGVFGILFSKLIDRIT